MITEGDCPATVHMRQAIIEQIGTINMLDDLAMHLSYAEHKIIAFV